MVSLKYSSVQKTSIKLRLRDFWNQILVLDTMVSIGYAAGLCYQTYKAQLIIRSKLVEMKFLKRVGRWDKLPRETRAQIASNPTTDNGAYWSWQHAMKDAEFRK